MTTTTNQYPNVPLPAGDGWQPEQYRIVLGLLAFIALLEPANEQVTGILHQYLSSPRFGAP
jgi:hypothetical protein